MNNIFEQWFDDINTALKAEDRQSERYKEVVLVYDENLHQWCLLMAN